MTTPARELRDALAEALWAFTASMEPGDWAIADEDVREEYRLDADLLLASLPSVKLKMGWEE